MKRFIKNLVIIVLVLGAVGGTAWFFYSNLVKNRDSYALTLDYQYSSKSTEFNALLVKANEASTINRFGLILDTNNKLNEINAVLVPYLSKADGSDVDQNKIYNYLDLAIEKQDASKDKFNEYISKASKVAKFDKNSGANPVYKRLSSYIVQYAKYLEAINEELDNIVNRSADVKFDLIEIYLNITISTFSNLEDVSGVTVVKNQNNLDKAKNIINFNNAYCGDFSSNVNLFMKNYAKCDKADFALTFAEKYDSVTALNNIAGNNAMYYLKKVVG